MSVEASRSEAWSERRLGDLVSRSRPICYGVLKPGTYAPDGVPLVRILDIESNIVDETGLYRIGRRLDEQFARSRLIGDELLVSIQGTVGRVALATDRIRGANISRTIARVAISGSAEARFVRHWLLSERGQKTLMDATVGTTRASLNLGDLRRIAVSTPPIREQRMVADILDAFDEAIHHTEQLMAKLKLMKHGWLHDLLTYGVDQNGQLRSPERYPEHFKLSVLGWIPLQWDVHPFGGITRSAQLGTGARGVDPLGDNLRLLKMGNLTWGAIDVADIEHVARTRVPDWHNLILDRGDLLFNTRNTPALVGKTVAWGVSLDKQTIFDNNILRVRFDDRASGEFVAAYMAHGEGRRRVGQLATGTTSVAAIYWKGLRRYLVPLPPRAEQDEIVLILRAIDDRLTAENEFLRKLRSLKGGVAQDLLTGRIRVTGPSEGDAA